MWNEWPAVLKILEASMTRAMFTRHFAGSQAAVAGKTIIVSVSRSSIGWMPVFNRAVKDAIIETTGRKTRIRWRIQMEKATLETRPENGMGTLTMTVIGKNSQQIAAIRYNPDSQASCAAMEIALAEVADKYDLEFES